MLRRPCGAGGAQEAHNVQSKRARDYWAQFTPEERSAILQERAKIREERRRATAMLGNPKAKPKGCPFSYMDRSLGGSYS